VERATDARAVLRLDIARSEIRVALVQSSL